jgi:hypothetical protein
MIPVERLKENPDNPRTITRDQFNRLVASIREFPSMLTARPLIVDAQMMVLGGNQRLRAIKQLGMKSVPVMMAEDWTEEERKEFLIRDNVNSGEWDVDMLANLFERETLEEYGLSDKELGLFLDDYERELEDIDNTKAEMPIVPKFSETYESVTIFSGNELDFNFLRNVLKLGSKKCYKNTRVGTCYVLTASEFAELWQNRKS